MKHFSKGRDEADQLRLKIKSVLSERHGWRGYDHIRDFLQSLLRQDQGYIFTVDQHEAVRRIILARRPFTGWAGYSVAELRRGARAYIADAGDEDEQFLNEIDAEEATQLGRRDMGHLVSLCILAGMEIPRFPPLHPTAKGD